MLARLAICNWSYSYHIAFQKQREEIENRKVASLGVTNKQKKLSIESLEVVIFVDYTFRLQSSSYESAFYAVFLSIFLCNYGFTNSTYF